MATMAVVALLLGDSQPLSVARLLLGHAVESAEAEDEIAAGDADDFAAGEKTGEGVECDAVVRVVEGGDDHEFVGDVEIRVAGGETLVVEIDRRGHGERFDAKGAAVEIFHAVCRRRDFPGAGVVRVGGFSSSTTTMVVG